VAHGVVNLILSQTLHSETPSVEQSQQTTDTDKQKTRSDRPFRNGAVASGSGRGMVMMPRMHTKAMYMSVRMVMEQRMTMAQRVPSRLLFPPATSVRAVEQTLLCGKAVH
jgi:hypothetical protein